MDEWFAIIRVNDFGESFVESRHRRGRVSPSRAHISLPSMLASMRTRFVEAAKKLALKLCYLPDPYPPWWWSVRAKEKQRYESSRVEMNFASNFVNERRSVIACLAKLTQSG